MMVAAHRGGNVWAAGVFERYLISVNGSTSGGTLFEKENRGP